MPETVKIYTTESKSDKVYIRTEPDIGQIQRSIVYKKLQFNDVLFGSLSPNVHIGDCVLTEDGEADYVILKKFVKELHTK